MKSKIQELLAAWATEERRLGTLAHRLFEKPGANLIESSKATDHLGERDGVRKCRLSLERATGIKTPEDPGLNTEWPKWVRGRRAQKVTKETKR